MLHSIKLGGQAIPDLPIAERAQALEQMPQAEETQLYNMEAEIRKSFPSLSTDYLSARIAECNASISNLILARQREASLISEYTTQLALCEVRDEQIKAAGEDKDLIRALKEKFPPYNLSAMKSQVANSQQTVDSINMVITQEHESISDLSSVLALCKQRDQQLKAIKVL